MVRENKMRIDASIEALKNSDCKFCEIYNSNNVRAISDTILYESKYFFVIPALGCLVKNYIMIISKRHIYSMCYLNEPERSELQLLLNSLRTMFKKKYGFYPIVFEHGGSNSDSNKSACCILHAHLHIVPYIITQQSEMIGALGLNPLSSFSKLFILGYGKPYIFFLDNRGELYFRDCETNVLPSQIIRKWIASDIGYPNAWDWRVNKFEENISATVADIKPSIKRAICETDYRLKYIYYCRAMDGLDTDEIEQEYRHVQCKLEEQGRILVNPYEGAEHQKLILNKINAELIVTENRSGISKADCVIVNLSKKNHTYIGCIAEMVYAKECGCYVIVIVGDTHVDKHFYTIFHADKIVHNLDELFDTTDWRK